MAASIDSGPRAASVDSSFEELAPSFEALAEGLEAHDEPLTTDARAELLASLESWAEQAALQDLAAWPSIEEALLRVAATDQVDTVLRATLASELRSIATEARR
jgi:hypothetical protein